MGIPPISDYAVTDRASPSLTGWDFPAMEMHLPTWKEDFRMRLPRGREASSKNLRKEDLPMSLARRV